jgi:hypothetical protein
MNAEFNWWLLIVGLVVGAGLVWLVIADWSRREEDLSSEERAAESGWIAETLRSRGEHVDPATAEEILELHRAYLRQTAGFADEALGEEAGEEAEDWGIDEPVDEPPEEESVAARPALRSSPLNPRSGAAPVDSDPQG